MPPETPLQKAIREEREAREAFDAARDRLRVAEKAVRDAQSAETQRLHDEKESLNKMIQEILKEKGLI
jgi:hypothetical protein